MYETPADDENGDEQMAEVSNVFADRLALYRAGQLCEDERKKIRKLIQTLVECGKTYIVLAEMGYSEEQLKPWRNDVVDFRFYSETLDDQTPYLKLEDTGLVIHTKNANKTGYEQTRVCGVHTRLYDVLEVWRSFMSILQKNDNDPWLFCMTDNTKTWIHVSEKKGTKQEIGTAVWTKDAFQNWRASMYKRNGIVVPKGHTGCHAARHTCATNNAIQNAELPPNARREAEAELANAMGHSVQTHHAVYVSDAIVNEALGSTTTEPAISAEETNKKRWSPGTTTEAPADYEPIQEMAEVDVDSVAMVTRTIPPQGPAQKKRKRQSRWGPRPSA